MLMTNKLFRVQSCEILIYNITFNRYQKFSFIVHIKTTSVARQILTRPWMSLLFTPSLLKRIRVRMTSKFHRIKP